MKAERARYSFAIKTTLLLALILLAFGLPHRTKATFDGTWYTNNCPGGTETITEIGVLQTRESTPGGDASNYGFCTAQRGTFPWGGSPTPPLPSGLSSVNVTASFLNRSLLSGSRYHIYVGFYYYLDSPVPLGTYQWMDTQVRIENIDGNDSLVGTTELYDPGDSFGWDQVVARLNPGQSYTFTTDVEAQFQSAIAAYGIQPTIGHTLMGIEVGTEGYLIPQLDVDWPSLTFNGTPEPLSTSLSFSPSSPIYPGTSTVTFTGSASGGTLPYSFSWNFGDGNTSTGQTTGHIYVLPGKYTVTLTSTDGLGATANATAPVVVSAQPLAVDFTFDPAAPNISQQITFSALVTGGTMPYAIQWDFGDGTTGTGESPEHTYLAAGTFSVTLNVTDHSSQSKTSSTSLNVYSPASPDFSVSLSPASVTVVAGQSGSTSLTLRSINGFTGNVSLSALSVFAVSFDQSSVTLPPGGSRVVSINVAVNSGASSGQYSIAINGTTSLSTRSTTLTVNVNLPVSQENRPPSITVPSVPSVTVGSRLTFTVSSIDPDQGDSVTLSVDHLPPGASFSPSTGVFSWTPSSGEAGNYTVTFLTTDNGSPPITTARSVTIVVRGTQPCRSCQAADFLGPNLWWILGLPIAGAVAALFVLRRRVTFHRAGRQAFEKFQKLI